MRKLTKDSFNSNDVPLWGVLFVVALTLISATLKAQDTDALSQRLLRTSHATRINDIDAKPWHLKINFQLFDPKGKPSETGTIEEWWAGLSTWKFHIESPSYTGTVVENRQGDFRTSGIGPVPLLLRSIESDFVYPMPMGENPGKTKFQLHHQKVSNLKADCIELSDPTIPMSFPSYCLVPTKDALLAIYSSSGSRSTLFEHIENFRGQLTARTISYKAGNILLFSASADELNEIQPSDGLFTPSADMQKVTDMHTLKITTVK
jgi:hypothetical protein